MKLPHVKKPCADCPFRKDSKKGWLGNRIKTYIEAQSFVCHKNNKLQCAGHMIIRADKSQFVRLAKRFGENISLSGHELVFNSEDECIKHHANQENDNY